MKKHRQTRKESYSLGDLIAALYEEAEKMSDEPVERNLLVYSALCDLMKNRKVEAAAAA